MSGDGRGWLILGGLSLIAVAVAAAVAANRDSRREHADADRPDAADRAAAPRR